ncbi:outer dense fiber protein 2-like [Periophthalmus magnuspinnatus]|uniref:outer dense fiber protein 2-like n=1 Tax=Periophthalmus magnuspinnatus TaxID=409849 RepID=UPI00145B77E6|nr:outer dense fiber protein 2-like [Periophthalmus magnuspinnatus]
MNDRETPPPVHVHVPEATPIHVHMKRSPSRKQEVKTSDPHSKEGRKLKAPPWIPPGKTPTRRNMDLAYDSQRSRSLHRSGSGIKDRTEMEEEDRDLVPVSRSLAVLLKEEEETNRRRSRKSECGAQFRDTDELLRALVEADIDGAAVTNQLSALKETLDRLSMVKRLGKMHTTSLDRQRDLLLEKVDMFASTSHSLRALLREWSEQERESLLWSEQRDALKKRLTDCETENIRLAAKLSNKEKETTKLAETLDLEKESNRTSEELSKLLESTRLHLETQLDRAQIENAQLTAQIQRMQQTQEQVQMEMRSLTDELWSVRRLRDDEERERREQETERAERAEEEMKRLSEKLHQKELQLAQALSSSSEWCIRHKNEVSAKEHLEQEIPVLKRRVDELVDQLHLSEEQNLTEREELQAQFKLISEQNTALNTNNHKLKGDLSVSEERLRELQLEARGLKTLLRKYESQVEKYKKKLHESRLESERFVQKLEEAEAQSRELKVQLSLEKEGQKLHLHSRLRELEDLPEKVRQTEQRLKEAQHSAETYERRNIEHTTTLTQLRLKVEQQGTQLDLAQQRNTLLQDENNSLHKKTQTLECKLEELKCQSTAQSQDLVLKEGLVLKLEKELEERSLEVSVLNSRLQQSLQDAKRQADEEMQRLLSKERVSQSKALDLQSELSRAKTELSLLQRSKQEMERRFQGQLQNLKERLEQSDSTNRALQNYVHFLKTSYGNVFGESLMQSH